MPPIRSSFVLSLLIASSASAVAMDWTFVGNPGNAADDTGFGAVGYAYNIGTYEVTNAQYVEFLNEKAASDPLELYSSDMGIMRFGGTGFYSYSAYPGREDMPVNFVSFYDALRFTNWLSNGQGTGDTETGAYSLMGGTATPSNSLTVTRNVGSTIFLTSEDEWYKAAYYSPGGVYFDYPVGSNAPTTCASPSAATNHANCNFAVGDLTPFGSYTGSTSPYGAFDLAGNVFEWTEAIVPATGLTRNTRGGAFDGDSYYSAASIRGGFEADWELDIIGFRVVMVVPEPGTGLLVFGGLLGIAVGRRSRH